MKLLLVLAGFGCAVGSDSADGSSFGSGTYTTTVGSTMDGTETGMGTGTEEDTGTTDTGTTDTGTTDTGTTDTGTTDTGTTDTGTTDTGTTSTTGGGGGQPDDGMYAMCLDPADCGGLPTCITLGGDPPTDGICSDDCNGANDPSNCDAVPEDATATKTCMVFDDGMGGWRYLCALACDGGKTCPGGMKCTNVMDGMNAKMICF